MSNAPSSAGSSVISGSDRKRRNKYKDYSFLTSTNLVYRNQLPPEYTLPSLIGTYAPNLRGINAIDNEEQIPDLDYKEAVNKFNKTHDSSQSLRKTFSENELCKYDWISGRRKSVSLVDTQDIDLDLTSDYKKETKIQDERSGSFWEPDYYHTHAKRAIFQKKYSKQEVFDEYIPSFSEFNLSKFGVEDKIAETFNDVLKEEVEIDVSKKRKNEVVDEYDNNFQVNKSKSVSPLESIGTGLTDEYKVEPITIENIKKIDINNAAVKSTFNLAESFPVSDECFKIAGSPERDSDRNVLSSIPKHFYSLSFSNRKKLLSEILPEELKNDTKYKDHISKILRKNSASFSTPASSVSLEMFAPNRSRNLRPKDNDNRLGSIILDKWKLGRVFNNGSFGIIRECIDVNDYTNVKAVKVIPLKKDPSKLYNCEPEIKIWSVLSDPTMVPLLDVKITIDFAFLIMPLYNEGSLFDKVKSWETLSIPLQNRLDDVLLFSESVAKGLLYLHERGLHHGDVKLENCLLEKNIPKLCDFGMTNFDFNVMDESNVDIATKFKQYVPNKLTKSISAEFKKALSLMTQTSSQSSDINTATSVSSSYAIGSMSGRGDYGYESDNELIIRVNTENNTSHDVSTNVDHSNDINIGSLPYAAPELLKPCPIPLDKSVDIWAFGVLIYTLIVLKLPFWHVYEPRLKLKIIEGNWETDEWKLCTDGVNSSQLDVLVKVIKGCLCDRKNRFDIVKINEIFTEARKV